MPAEVGQQLVELKNIPPLEFGLFGKKIKVFISPEGTQLDVNQRVDTNHLRGPARFDAFVDFGDLFINLSGNEVPKNKRWSKENPPPDGVEYLEFDDPSSETVNQVMSASRVIESFANDYGHDPFLNPLVCNTYTNRLTEIMELARKRIGSREGKLATGIARAGLPVNEMLGYKTEEQIIFDTKRLYGRGDHDRLCVGIRIKDRDRVVEIRDRDVEVGDGAGATLASLMAKTLVESSLGAKPRSETWIFFALTQQGALISQEFLRTLGIQGRLLAACYCAKMSSNPPYYLLTPEGRFQVGDVGDFLDIKTPPEFRILWPKKVEDRHINKLSSESQNVDWKSILQPGAEFTLNTAIELRKLAVRAGHGEKFVGKILCNLPQTS